MKNTSELFLEEVEEFLAEVGMEPSVLGARAINDPNLVRQLRCGRNPNLSTVDRIRGFMRSERASRRDAA